MASKFVTSIGKNDKHYFSLKAGNGEIILSSQGYASSSSCAGGIDSVRRNSQTPERFEQKTASDGRLYFVLTATNGQTVGKSQMYKTESGCKNGIASIAKNAPDAKVTKEE